MKRSRKILFIILAVVLLALAGFSGYFYGFQEGIRAGHMTAELAEFTLAHQHLEAQMANAKCLELKESLNEYLMLLEKYKDFERGVFLSRTVYYGDKMLTHARLALIARKLGDEKEASKHMKLAVEACNSRGWKDCSENSIISFTRKIEEKNPIACLSDSE